MVKTKYNETVIGVELSFTSLTSETPTAKLTCKLVREDGSEIYPTNPTTTIDFSTMPAGLQAKIPEVVSLIKQAVEHQMEAIYGAKAS